MMKKKKPEAAAAAAAASIGPERAKTTQHISRAETYKIIIILLQCIFYSLAISGSYDEH